MSERKVVFTRYGWETYSSWLTRDRTVLKAANKQIAAALIDPFRGVGKPEPLKHHLSGQWSRRITREHRLVYQVTETEIVIVAVGGHYDE
ncbi:Txe/YoeB family addiction module toxin [Nocardia shimofusensis]|uniref:Txe/YoeB family addiction module toxin n=1 Tax=Nocardia shimofusensis TaxID=228596 RepID=UPI000829ADB9|nr:Txe/YoeB family addiction module toxin [Nocardia shimofusensis]